MRKCCMFFRTPTNSDALKKYTSLVLMLDCKTRWSSLAKAIERFLEIKAEIAHALVDLKMPAMVTEDEIKILEQVLNALKPVETAVTQLSSQDCNLLSADIILSEMIESLDKLADSDIKNRLKDNLITRINQRRTKFSDVLAYLFQNYIPLDTNLFYSPIDVSEISRIFGEMYPISNEPVIFESNFNLVSSFKYIKQ